MASMSDPNAGAAAVSDKVFDLFSSLDPRMVSATSAFNAKLGASAITFAITKVTAPNNQVLVFNINPASPNIVMQNDILIQMDVIVPVEVCAAKDLTPGTAFPVLGTHFALAAQSPINQLTTSITANFSSSGNTVTNVGQRDFLGLKCKARERIGKPVNYRKPTFTNWDDAYLTSRGLGSVADLEGDGDIPPGAQNMTFFIPQGVYEAYQVAPNTPWVVTNNLATAGMTTAAWATKFNATTMYFAVGYSSVQGTVGGSPTWTDATIVGLTLPVAVASQSATSLGQYPGGLTPVAQQLPLGMVVPVPYAGNTPAGFPYIAIRDPSGVAVKKFAIGMSLQDTLMCTPFGDDIDDSLGEQGVWGISSLMLSVNLGDPSNEEARWFQGPSITGLNTMRIVPGQFQVLDSQVLTTYLSPMQNKKQLMPPRCTLRWYQRQTAVYADNRSGTALAPGASKTSSFPAFTYGNLPELFIVTARPMADVNAGSRPHNETDFLAALGNNPVPNLTVANMTGPMQNVPKSRLVAISRRNGAVTSMAEAGGTLGASTYGSVGSQMLNGNPVGMAGIMIVLCPGVDFAVPEGCAGGTAGQVTVSFDLTYWNAGRRACYFVITAQAVVSGWWVLDNGAGRSVLPALDELSVTTAPSVPDAHNLALEGGSWTSRIGNIFGKVMKHHKGFQQLWQTVKDTLSNHMKNGMHSLTGLPPSGGGGPTAGGSLRGGGWTEESGSQKLTGKRSRDAGASLAEDILRGNY